MRVDNRVDRLARVPETLEHRKAATAAAALAVNADHHWQGTLGVRQRRCGNEHRRDSALAVRRAEAIEPAVLQ